MRFLMQQETSRKFMRALFDLTILLFIIHLCNKPSLIRIPLPLCMNMENMDALPVCMHAVGNEIQVYVL